MKRSIAIVIGAVLLGAARPATPTSVIEPTFDELVARAETIFVGTAIDRRSEWEVTRTGRTIITLVSFDVERVLKGRVGARTQLTFLGGTIGDETLHIADMPQFRVGDRDLLFLSADQRSISPLVAFAHGRFRITRDLATGAETIRTHDGRPLISTAELGRPLAPLMRLPRTLTLSEFESAVRQRVDARQR